MAGIFVAIEGVDAAGKGTQSKLLAKRLNGTRIAFPYIHTEVGRLIQAHLERKWSAIGPMHCTCDNYHELCLAHQGDPLAFQSLMILNRYEMAPQIVKLREKGTSVICDRFNESAVVFGHVNGLPKEYLHELGAYLPQPDIQILLDIPLEEVFRRRPEGRDRHETDPGLLSKVITAYREEWKEQQVQYGATAWPIVNGVGSIEEVQARICEAVANVRKAS